jgi:integrase
VAGMPLPQLQKIMGHHSPELTMKYYVHVQEAEMQRAITQIELGLPGRKHGPKSGTRRKRRQ